MIPRMIRTIVVALIGAVLLSACNLRKMEPASNSVSADSDRPLATSTPVATSPSPTSVTAGAAVESSATIAAANGCHAAASRPTRRIQANVTVDYASRAVYVSQRIEFVNRESAPIEDIILDVQTNQWEGIFSLSALQVDSRDISYKLERNRLELDLVEALAPDCWLEIALEFSLQPAAIGDGLRSYRGFFGYSPRQLNLGHFLPTVAARLNGAWRIHQPIGIGEQIVYEVADWQVDVTVEGAAESLQLAAPGTITPKGAGRWSVELSDSRDLALSLSEDFILLERELAQGATLAVYTFADAVVNDRGLELDGGAHVLAEAEKALHTFTQRFGDYPWKRLVIVQGDFPDGMEFTGLVFVGSGWFYGFDGTPRNYLTLISVHEVAHQWWYARVGNDAALNPWLDEALATYSEYIYVETHYPEDKNWWWTFRVAAYLPQGLVDYPVYEFNTPREYINAVYLRGAQMLQNLRADIGDDAFFKLLRAYYVAGDTRIAEPDLFWRQLGPEQQAATKATRIEFLSDPALAEPAGDTS